MSTASVTGPLVYSAVGPATLLSRAWNLLRYHLKPSILVMLVPAVLGVISTVALNISSAIPTFSKADPFAILMIALPVWIGMSIIGFFVWLFSMAVLSRMYYTALIQGKPIGIKEALRGVFRSTLTFWSHMTLYLAAGIMYICFLIVDAAAGFVAITGLYILMLVAAAVVAGGMYLGNQSAVGMVLAFVLVAVGIFILIVGGALIGLFFVGLISIQGAIFFFPLVGAANSNKSGYIDLLEKALESYRLLGANVVRATLFGILLFVLYYALSFAMSFPMIFWNILEAVFNSMDDPGVMPLHHTVIASVYSAVVWAIIWPYIFAAITIFWYDCRVRTEALDIRLTLYRLNERLKSKMKRVSGAGTHENDTV